MTNGQSGSASVSYLKALGAPLSSQEIHAGLASEPLWSGEVRALPALERQMGIASISKSFQPLPAHCRLAEEIQVILRSGYANRIGEPSKAKAENFQIKSHHVSYSYQAMDLPLIADNSGLSGCLLGYPGTGKSTAIKRALSLISPQPLKRHVGLSPQLVWLDMACPVTPTVKAFCLSFLEALGRAIENPEIKGVFGHPTASVDALPSEVVRLARNHAIGLLVIDDIQHLRAVKNGEDKRILELLETLSGQAGVPVLLVGTNAAAEVVCGAPRTALRSVGFASEVWERVAQGPEWDRFLRWLWRYQWTRVETPLTSKLSSVFYDRCQGILSLAVKLYQRTQVAVIRQAEILKSVECQGEDALIKQEQITPAFVEAVSDYLFEPVQSLMDALRSRDPAKLYGFEDFRPLPSEAKRMKEDKKAEEEGRRSDPEEQMDDTQSDGTSPDATDEEIKETIKSTEKVTEEMLAMARDICLEAGCGDTETDKYLAEIMDVLRYKIHEQRQKFFQELEGRLKARKARLRRADDPADEPAEPSQYNKEDLRRILAGLGDAHFKLRTAEIDGRRGLMLDA
jgi:hypothetical protein